MVGVVIATMVAPLIVLAIAPMTLAYEALRRRYIATNRELKRLDSLAVSPVLSSLTETLQVHYPHP